MALIQWPMFPGYACGPWVWSKERQDSAGAAGAPGDFGAANYDGGSFGRKLDKVSDVFQAPFVMAQPEMMNRKICDASGVEVQSVGGDPDHVAFVVKKLDGFESEAGEVVLALGVEAQEFATIIDMRIPTAAQGDDSGRGDASMVFFPSSEIIQGKMTIRVGGGLWANINDSQWSNELLGGDAIGTVEVGAMQWGIKVGANVFD